MKKVIYIDTETTGLYPDRHGMIEVACIVEYDKKVVDKLAFNINALTYNKPIEVTDDALEINGKSIKEINGYPRSKKQFRMFLNFLGTHVNQYDKEDKLQVIGYNPDFDMKMIQSWFEDNGNDFCWAYFKNTMDVWQMVKHLEYAGKIDTENHQLGTMCQYFGIKHDAHKAMADIKATRKLHHLLIKRFIK